MYSQTYTLHTIMIFPEQPPAPVPSPPPTLPGYSKPSAGTRFREFIEPVDFSGVVAWERDV